ncbi:hypothetical protein [Paenibacillus sp. FSL R7-277]|uniref:hypothetical protein n=1 Tax=unclassified Paenibacillus TaxID=185978 RepID=UPI0003E2649E|nr:hypothetical protein [Paenibacillus sp. FSL R7-277]ETT63290.1 hypothetical protein C173_23382 [Paenibacillus sp. FSL R7-277]OMG02600.1 hypothetical protein BK146_02545 [Paenibacillus sp. FSL R7-0333]
MAKVQPKQTQRLVTARVLRSVAAAMLPFYRKIAGNRSYARQWTTAIVTADLDLMGSLLHSIPALADAENYGTNGIGYFISFPFPLPVAFYTNGTTIPPGTAQFTFNTDAHRCIARSIIPLYRELAVNRSFAEAMAAAIRRKDNRAVRAMVRSHVKTTSLKSVTIEESGIALLFKTRFSRYPYRNLLFQEMM